MIEKLGQEQLHRALAALGKRLRGRTEIVLGGAGALILTGDLKRATSDCDVLYSDPDIGRLQDDIRAVAHRLGCQPASMASPSTVVRPLCRLAWSAGLEA